MLFFKKYMDENNNLYNKVCVRNEDKSEKDESYIMINFDSNIINIKQMSLNVSIIDYIGMHYDFVDNGNWDILTSGEVRCINYVFLTFIRTYYNRFKLYNIYFDGGEDYNNMAYDENGIVKNEKMYKYLEKHQNNYKDYNMENFKKDNFIALLICCAMFNEYARKFRIYSRDEIYCIVVAIVWIVIKMEDDDYYGLNDLLNIFYHLRNNDNIFIKCYDFMTLRFIENVGNRLYGKHHKYICKPLSEYGNSLSYYGNRIITRKTINDRELRIFCECLNYNYYGFLEKYNINKIREMRFNYIEE